MSIEDFRVETRAWIEANCPEGASGPGQIPFGSSKVPLSAEVAAWLQAMVSRGWTVPTWPKEYGGAGL